MNARVVVVFASRRGSTERLATAAAVGAVEMRGEIRLRLLPDSASDLPPEGAYLAKEYVPPRDADAAWADALILLLPSWLDPASPDLERWFTSLDAIRQSGRWRLRAAAVIAPDATRAAVEPRLAALGLSIIPPPTTVASPEDARMFGRATGCFAGDA